MRVRPGRNRTQSVTGPSSAGPSSIICMINFTVRFSDFDTCGAEFQAMLDFLTSSRSS